MRSHIVEYWRSIETTYGTSDRCLVFCRTIDDAKKFAELLDVLPFHSECLDDDPVEKFRAGEQKILPTTIRLGCGFHYEHIRHVIHLDLAYSIIDQYQEDSRGGRDGQPCHAITFVEENRPCPYDKAAYDLGAQAVWEWSRNNNQCLRIIPSQFLDGVAVTCDLVPGAQLCVFCRNELSKDPPLQPALLPVRPILRLSNTPSLAVTPLYANTPQQPPTRPTPMPTTSSRGVFQTPLRKLSPVHSSKTDGSKGSSPVFTTISNICTPVSPSLPPFEIPSSPPVFQTLISPQSPTQSLNKRKPQDSSILFYPPSKRPNLTPNESQHPKSR